MLSSLHAQETKIEISNLGHIYDFRDDRCDDTFVLTAFYNGGEKIIIEYRKGYKIGSGNNATYTVPGILTKLEVYQYAKDAEDQITKTSCSGGKSDTATTNLGTSLNPCSNGFFSNEIRRGNDMNQTVSFNYKITPLPKPEKLNPSQLDMGYEDDLTLSATTGVNTSVYNWQYGFKTGEVIAKRFDIFCVCFVEVIIPTYDWFEIPVTNQRQPTINLSDFLDESVVGKEIFFRIRPCSGFGSDLISYNVKKSAPYILNAVGNTTTCYDDQDGTVVITLASPIDLVNDELGIQIEDPSRLEELGATGIFRPFTVGYTKEELLPFINAAGTTITIPNLSPTRGADFIVSYKADPTFYFSDSDDHKATFRINRRDPVEFESALATTEVLCYGGNDGTIIIRAKGGTGSYQYLYDNLDNSGNELPNEGVWTTFTPSSSTHIITELTKGNYEVQIRDTIGCIASLQSPDLDPDTGDVVLLDEYDTRSIKVEEPVAPLTLEYIPQNIIEPTAHGFENGEIQVVIQGGTQFDTGDLYTIEWKNVSGQTLTDIRKEVVASGSENVYRATLYNIPTGIYFISVYDANHAAATYKDTCFIFESEQSLGQPDPLVVNLSIDNEISCNIDNEYSNGVDFVLPRDIMDQFQDGVIVAEVTGGVSFDTTPDASDCRDGSTLPYCFHWKKNVNGIWVDIDVNTNTIVDQSVGDYSLNITDKNGISLGDYQLVKNAEGVNEYILSQETDVLINLPQPDKLEVTFEKTAVTCNDGKDAEAEVFVTGGTPPYEYSWSTGAETTKVSNLSAQAYIVYISDSKGCQIEGSVTIEQPNGLAVTSIIEKAPTCFEGSDGEIQVEVTGGITPYKLTWNTGGTLSTINELTEGVYSLEVEDFQGCKTFFDTTLIDPEEIIVDLGGNRSLCGGQSLLLDIGIDDAGATYLWESDNGFTSTQPNVELTNGGTYTATLTTGLGCVGVDIIEVKVFETSIDADFLITTQAYVGEEVILVNVSEPLGDNIEWTVPDNVEMVSETDEKLTMLFADSGPYEIQLRSYQGDCYEDYYKTIIVQPAQEGPVALEGSQQFIEEFICFPNPTDGDFNVKIALTENSNITLKMLDLLTGAVLVEKTEFNQQDFLVDFSMTHLPQGLYFMLLETPKGSETRKIILE